jgi:hypothetical protein
LVIRKAEKAQLIKKLVSDFGDSLNQDSKNLTVGAGFMMKGFLEEHLCSDDRWE